MFSPDGIPTRTSRTLTSARAVGDSCASARRLHPGSRLETGEEAGHAVIADQILQEFALRLRSLQKRGAITDAPHQTLARFLIGIAHDLALHRAVLVHRPQGGRPPLSAFVDLAWRGIAPAPGKAKSAGTRSKARSKP